jgi:hypothetical protein
MTAYTSGIYSFASESFIDTYGCFYSYPFNPYNPTQNLMADDDDGTNSNQQFRINITLSYGRTYILVVTTYRESTTGNFLVRALGPASISLTSFIPATSK